MSTALNKALHDAAQKGNVTEIQRLLKEGADKDSSGANRATPLIMAAASGNSAAVQCLLDIGADHNRVDGYRSTPLHVAAELGFTDIVDLLIRSRCDINQGNLNFSTPLLLAAGKGRDAVCELLVRKGATVDSRNRNGRSALDSAIFGKHKKTVGILLAAGATVTDDVKLKLEELFGEEPIPFKTSTLPCFTVSREEDEKREAKRRQEEEKKNRLQALELAARAEAEEKRQKEEEEAKKRQAEEEEKRKKEEIKMIGSSLSLSANLTVEQVGMWLTAKGAEEGVEKFADQKIDGEALLKLAEKDLEELGLKMGSRKKVLAAIEESRLSRSAVVILPAGSPREQPVFISQIQTPSRKGESPREISRGFQQAAPLNAGRGAVWTTESPVVITPILKDPAPRPQPGSGQVDSLEDSLATSSSSSSGPVVITRVSLSGDDPSSLPPDDQPPPSPHTVPSPPVARAPPPPAVPAPMPPVAPAPMPPAEAASKPPAEAAPKPPPPPPPLPEAPIPATVVSGVPPVQEQLSAITLRPPSPVASKKVDVVKTTVGNRRKFIEDSLDPSSDPSQKGTN